MIATLAAASTKPWAAHDTRLALVTLGGIAIILEAAWRIARGPGGWLARVSELLLGLCAVYGIWAIVACGLVNFNLHY